MMPACWFFFSDEKNKGYFAGESSSLKGWCVGMEQGG
jgi:hypothetical protein